ncbi:hypothetical protein M413DRAFT_443343 [Hebeloma cylindrosporum]|uniref:F-box domain-containing protein n=1 Tax=Hebeloma cylindrosporum TaxID=76867 RepID=A0A0C2YTK3_HEBCY|nr:hypothetical protein M413DRAFT_443343 [Hebeloma cylindrosporum h7]
MPEHKQSPLLSLAPELMQVITDELTVDAGKNLRLTCKHLGEFLNIRLFRDLTSSFSKDNFEIVLSKVRILATKDCHAACSGTRTLKINSLSPAYDPGYRDAPAGWIEPEDPPEATAAEEVLKGYLFKAIAPLKGVQSVVWKPSYKDGEWAQREVMNALKTLPELRALDLQTAHLRFALPLHDLSGLQEVYICDINEERTAEVFDNFAKLVARSPRITFMDITSCWRFSSDGSPILHRILKHYPKGSSRLRLRHLSLKFCIALKFSKIYLEELSLNIVVPSFLEYLASYSGLKKLRLISGCSDLQSDSMAREFFSTSFINHIQSLESLRISALYEGSWCFGPWNEAIVSRCTKLKTFEMAIVSSHLFPSEESGVERNVVELLIDTVSNSMLQLESLSISVATFEYLRRATSENPAMQWHFPCPVGDIISSAHKYKVLPTCHRLPMLTAIGHSRKRPLVPIGPDEDGPLRYLETTTSSKDDTLDFDSIY